MLTPKQELFCHEYIKDRNGTQAAIRAGYSPATAKEQAYELLTKLHIQAKINQLIKEQLDRLKIKSDFVVRELLNIATANIADAYNVDGTLKAIEDMPEPIMKAIAFMKRVDLFDGQGKERKKIGCNWCVRFYDRIRALELLGKHLKMFTDKHEITGLENLAERVKAARERVEKCRQKSAP